MLPVQFGPDRPAIPDSGSQVNSLGSLKTDSMPDRQASKELSIFQAFAKAAGLASGEAHWEKRHPPEPDVLWHGGAEPVAFELVEIIDQDFAERVWSQLKLKSRFEQSFLALPTARRARIEERVGNALVHVIFEGGANLRSKQESVDLMFHYLANLDHAFEGELRKSAGELLPAAVSSVRIARLSSGPFFDVDAVGSLCNPTVHAVRGKWAKWTRLTAAEAETSARQPQEAQWTHSHLLIVVLACGLCAWMKMTARLDWDLWCVAIQRRQSALSPTLF